MRRNDGKAFLLTNLVGVEEVGVDRSRQEAVVLEHVQQERDVGLNAADAELAQRSVHFRRRSRQVGRVRDHLSSTVIE